MTTTITATPVETRTLTHRGLTITLTRVIDGFHGSFHGSFWSWRVGDHETPAYYRHSCIAHDDARAYIDAQQRKAAVPIDYEAELEEYQSDILDREDWARGGW